MRQRYTRMHLIYWDKSVVINLDDGITHSVCNVADAENILLTQWKRFDLDSLGNAVLACLTCVHDQESTIGARTAFKKAAETSGLLA